MILFLRFHKNNSNDANKWHSFVIRFFTCLLLLFVSGSCAYNPVVGRKSYNFFTLTDDIVLGEVQGNAAIEEFRSNGHPVDQDQAMVAQLNTMVTRIAAVSHMPKIPWEAHYVQMDVVNAFAYPGGMVFVISGLMDPQKGLVPPNDMDSLAMVIGHEMAHVTARHGTERMSKTVTTVTIAESLAYGVQAAGQATGSPYYPVFADTFNNFLVLGVNILIPSYSRPQEHEADRIGMSYAAKAGYNPEAAIKIWRQAASKSGPEYSIYSSHPSNLTRVYELEKYLPEAKRDYEIAKSNPNYWASLTDEQVGRPAGYQYDVARAYTVMGNAYTNGGKYQLAQTQYQQALSITPQNPDAHVGLGFSYLVAAKTNRQAYQQAEREFNTALRYDPTSTNAIYGLGLVYARTGNRQRAINAYDKLRYLDADLANHLAQEIR